MKKRDKNRRVQYNDADTLKKIRNIFRIIYSSSDADKLTRQLKNRMDLYRQEETVRS